MAKMEAVMLHQRMLMAKMLGLADKSLHPDALSDADLPKAEALLAASETITGAVKAATKPVL